MHSINTSAIPYYPPPPDLEEEKSSAEQEQTRSTISTPSSPSPQDSPSVTTLTSENERILSQLVEYSTSHFTHPFSTHKKLTSDEATLYIETLMQNKELFHLSALNVLFVDIIQTLRQLTHKKKSLSTSIAYTRDNERNQYRTDVLEPALLLKNLSVNLHYLFRAFREYSKLHYGKTGSKNTNKILEAREIYTAIVNTYLLLEDIIESESSQPLKQLCLDLKKKLDVLYHICHNEKLLEQYSQSMTPNSDHPITTLLIYPPTLSLVQFYLDSLDTCSYSMNLAQEQIKNDYIRPIVQLIADIRKIPKSTHQHLPLEKLLSDLQKLKEVWVATINDFTKKIEEIAREAKQNQANQQLKSCLENASENPFSFFQIIENIHSIMPSLMKPWDTASDVMEKTEGAGNTFNDCTQALCQSLSHLQRQLPKKKKVIKKPEREELQKIISSVHQITSGHSFGRVFNALINESFRIPFVTIQEIRGFYAYIYQFNEKGHAFRQSLLTSTQQPCSSFNPLDLLIHNLFAPVETANPLLMNPQEAQVIKKLTSCLTALISYTSDDTSQPNFFLEHIFQNKYLKIQELYEHLSTLTNNQNGVWQNEIDSLPHLKNIIQQLHEYLKLFPPNISESTDLCKHLFTVLTTPFCDREELSNQDLGLIRRHIALLAQPMQLKDFEQKFEDVKKELQTQLNSATLHGQHFWKLNLKCISLILKPMQNMHHINCQYEQILNECQDQESVLLALHKREHDLESYHHQEHTTLRLQVNLLVFTATRKEELNTLRVSLEKIVDYINWVNYINETFIEITKFYPCPNSPPSTPEKLEQSKTPTSTPSSSDEAESDNESQEILPTLNQEVYQASPSQDEADLFDQLQQRIPSLLNVQESIEAYLFRTTKRDELVQNNRFYLALIEEVRGLDAHSLSPTLKLRGQVDYLLLLEATEKIVLASLQMEAQEEPNTHVLNSTYQKRPLVFTHDGKKLVEIIRNANLPWFEDPKTKVFIEKQESELKLAYWFHQDHQRLQTDLASITACCTSALQSLAASTSVSKQMTSNTLAVSYKAMNTYAHQKKVGQTISPYTPVQSLQDNFTNLEKALDSWVVSSAIDPRCTTICDMHIQAIKRTISLAKELEACASKKLFPLYFAVRSSEIQVSLLSLTLRLSLCALKTPNPTHPLFLDHKGLTEGRPLIHNHRVDQLLHVLKKEIKEQPSPEIINTLETYLPLFVGDPRYPYPNKKALTNELINTYEMVYLLQKSENNDFFNSEDKRLFFKHLGETPMKLPPHTSQKILHQKIENTLDNQILKMNCAFDLARKILSIKI